MSTRQRFKITIKKACHHILSKLMKASEVREDDNEILPPMHEIINLASDDDQRADPRKQYMKDGITTSTTRRASEDEEKEITCTITKNPISSGNEVQCEEINTSNISSSSTKYQAPQNLIRAKINLAPLVLQDINNNEKIANSTPKTPGTPTSGPYTTPDRLETLNFEALKHSPHISTRKKYIIVKTPVNKTSADLDREFTIVKDNSLSGRNYSIPMTNDDVDQQFTNCKHFDHNYDHHMGRRIKSHSEPFVNSKEFRKSSIEHRKPSIDPDQAQMLSGVMNAAQSQSGEFLKMSDISVLLSPFVHSSYMELVAQSQQGSDNNEF